MEREISQDEALHGTQAPFHLQEHLSQYPEIEEEVSRKDNKLLSLIRDVYVDFEDPYLPCQ